MQGHKSMTKKGRKLPREIPGSIPMPSTFNYSLPLQSLVDVSLKTTQESAGHDYTCR